MRLERETRRDLRETRRDLRERDKMRLDFRER